MLISSALPHQRCDSRVFSENYLSLDRSFSCQAFALLPCQAKLRRIPLVSVVSKLSRSSVDLPYFCAIRRSGALRQPPGVGSKISAQGHRALWKRKSATFGGLRGLPRA